MFYAISKKGTSDMEKEAVQSLSKSIKKIDFVQVSMLDLVKPNDLLFKDIQQIVLDIYLKGPEYGFKKKIKDIKKLQSTHGLKKLMETYLEMTTELYSQNNDGMELEMLRHKEFSSEECQEHFISSKRFGVFASQSICLLSIILNNDLFNYDIEYMQEINNELKIIKSFKKEQQCVISPNDGIPFLTDISISYMLALYRSKYGDDNYNSLAVAVSTISTSRLTMKYLFKEKYPKLMNDLPNITNIVKHCIENEKHNEENMLVSTMYLVDTNLLRKRKVLLPTNGVIIKNLDSEIPIESILLHEFETNFGLYVAGVVRYNSGFEYSFDVPIHTRGNHLCNIPDSPYIFDFIYDFYGVKDLNMKYEIISPYYWKYRHSNYETNTEKESRLKGLKVKREYEIKINSFVRKINGNPSKEALALAKKLFIELEPNTTIVKSHTRTYNKVKNNS